NELLDFAASCEGKAINKLEVARDLLVANLAFAVGAEFLFTQLCSRLKTHYGQQFLAKEPVRHPQYMYISHFGMTHQEFLYFTGKDILATANDHLFETPHNIHVAASVHRRQIAGMQPAFAINRLSSFFGHLIIALHHKIAPATEFATFPTGYCLACGGIDNLCLNMSQRDTHRCRL